MKFIVLVTAALVGFLVAFGATAWDEIALMSEEKLEEGFQEQCVTHLRSEVPDAARAVDVCNCMEADFEAQGYTLTDSFGTDFPGMAAITRSCIALYN